MNRRMFFQRTALLPAVLQSGAKGSNLSARAAVPALGPFEADLAKPGALKYVDRSAVELFVRLEEENPADPGELSGARLHVIDSGACMSLSASIGDVLQPYGERTSHWLGLMGVETVTRLLLAVDNETEFAIYFEAERGKAWNPVQVQIYAGENPELKLRISGHCLGVLRGELLKRLFDCLRKRCALGDDA